MKTYQAAEQIVKNNNDATLRMSIEGDSGTLIKITPESKLMCAITNIINNTIPRLTAQAQGFGCKVVFCEITESGSVITSMEAL